MGQAQEHYLEEKPLFTQIPAENLLIQNGTTEQVIAYGDKVVELCDRKGTLIIEEGADAQLVTSIRKRLNAFAVAEMKSRQAIDTDIDKNELWRKEKSDAKALRDRIISYAEVGAEDQPELQEKLQEIITGQGNDDLIHDMLDISGFVRDHPELFAQFPKFDMNWVEQAEEYFEKMRHIRAMIDRPGETVAALLLEERQAYTHLELSLKEIAKFGRLALYGDQDSLDQLKRDYMAANSARGKAEAAKENAQQL